MGRKKDLLVSELFYSLQGESSHAGLPCVFIRLQGCNQRCSYCDAAYSYEEEGQQVSLDKILTFVKRYKTPLVEITGGEPLLQEGVYPLLKRLVQLQYTTLIETNGSISIENVPLEVCVIIDIKCPDSGSATSFLPANLEAIHERQRRDPRSTEIKFVLSSGHDYRWAKKFITTHGLIDLAPILFSPVVSSFQAPELAKFILADQLHVRLQLQLHTLLWPGQGRGI